jgi:hypothetical protein
MYLKKVEKQGCKNSKKIIDPLTCGMAFKQERSSKWHIYLIIIKYFGELTDTNCKRDESVISQQDKISISTRLFQKVYRKFAPFPLNFGGIIKHSGK